MQQFAGLLQALPRNFAYGLEALIEQGGAPGAPARRAGQPAEAPDAERGRGSSRRGRRTTEAEAPAEAAPAPRRRDPPPRRHRTRATKPAAEPTRSRDRRRGRCCGHPHGGKLIMATKEEILDSIAGMSVLELSELLKDFEEKFGVTAAAPVAVAAGPRRWRRRRRGCRRGAGRVRRRPDRGRRQEDPGHQGGSCPHEPRPQGRQGPRRRRPQARAREGVEGRRREGQGASSKRPAPPSSSSSHRRSRDRPIDVTRPCPIAGTASRRSGAALGAAALGTRAGVITNLAGRVGRRRAAGPMAGR